MIQTHSPTTMDKSQLYISQLYLGSISGLRQTGFVEGEDPNNQLQIYQW